MYGRIPYLNISLISWAIHGSDLRRLLYYIEVWLVPHWACPYSNSASLQVTPLLLCMFLTEDLDKDIIDKELVEL